ncbi:DUF3820 family protein [bacterium]|nr:DUF3820 family protein [Bacteroidota bacterium]MDB0058333.1 DUF3820 family protein [Salibacteraceae bacterium]MDB9984084.1 DUF3820 family protein [bacterium]MDC1204271.1 DUF3820 family protein [Salibacteraceae bacterium]
MENEILKSLLVDKMPYGKYKDTILAKIPVSYLEWMAREQAFPKGRLGMQLHTVYEIKINGLERLLRN